MDTAVSYARTFTNLAPQPNYRFDVMKMKFYDNPGDANQTKGIKC